MRVQLAGRLVLFLLTLTADPGLFGDVFGDFEYTARGKTAIIARYTGKGDRVEIPETINGLPVTAIGDYAFLLSGNLTSVAIPNSVTAIGEGAFSGCLRLTGITIPKSVAKIGLIVFFGCANLTNITVDGQNAAYAGSNGILFDKQMRTLLQYPSGKSGSSYTIPRSVVAVGDGAFIECSNLKSVIMPNSVVSVGELAFFGCVNLKSVSLSRRTAVGPMAFPEGVELLYSD
ncbi:MAG: leucine-rich repeat domain-containing protein [Spirochaetaceae bacterium]|jgi:hypothetical protein|nr:leucine-rich repeat domain-containing protein [Spirochaetaceae bacterium]